MEQITSPVTVTLKNTTTGAVQKKEVTESGLGFYITEAGAYTLEADLESVLLSPKAFNVTHERVMTTLNVNMREGSNIGYIGNYIGAFITQ